MNLEQLTKFVVVMVCLEMTAMTVQLSCTYYLANKDLRHTFLKTLCLLFIAADISGALFTVLSGFELKGIFDDNILPTFWRIMLGTSLSVYMTGQCIVHWMFAFKYYVISQEIPNALKV